MASGLTTAEIDLMQSDAASIVLPDTCTIERATRASDGKGGKTLTWATLASSIACRLDEQTRTGFEDQASGRVTAKKPFRIWLPDGQSIKESDRIKITSLSNRYFQVAAVPAGSWEILRPVDCDEVGISGEA